MTTTTDLVAFAASYGITTDQIVRDLHRAADVLAEQGWTTGQYRDGDGRVCVIGALRVAVAGAAYPPYPQRTLASGARLTVGTDILDRRVADVHGFALCDGITGWNDYICQSGEQARAFVRATADELAKAAQS